MHGAATRAFTLADLLVVVVILGILAALLRPALAGSQQDAKSFQCLNNMRQMIAGWILYAQDNHDMLADNHDVEDYGQFSPPAPPGTPAWCEGILDWTTSSANTNVAGLIGPTYSLLGNYVGSNAQIFRCPADVFLSSAQRTLGWTNRCRSIAMDGNVGLGKRISFGWQSGVTNPVSKMSGFTLLGPSMSWVFLDEHPDCIDDGQFFVNPALTNGVGQLTELPANYHNNGSGLSFADGHAEIHRWLDPRIILPVTYIYDHGLPLTFTAVSPCPDLAWLAQHTPYQQSAW